MEQAEDAHGQRFAAGRQNEEDRLHVPETEQIDCIPGEREFRSDQRQLDVPEQRPSARAAEAGVVKQFRRNTAESIAGTLPRERKVAHSPGEKNDAEGVVKEVETGAVEDRDKSNAEEHTGNKEGQPEHRAETPAAD